MRHGKKFNHLGRKKGHRVALLRNLAGALVKHKRITTTLAKAKALRVFIEPLITKSKNNSTHSRRIVFSYLNNKDVVAELFGNVAEKVASRPGGYTRVIRTGFRKGDGAEMAMIELVDYNTTMISASAASAPQAKAGKRTRRAGGKKLKSQEGTSAAAASENAENAPENNAGEMASSEEQGN